MARTKGKCRLSRLFKNRDVVVEEAQEEHLKWFWAAYNKGAFETSVEKGLDQGQFVQAVSEIAQVVEALFIVSVNDKAVGVISIATKYMGDTHYAEPHFDWFPWATDRNKIEGAAKMVLELREKAPLFINVKKKEKDFVTHIAKYGILRRVGKLDQAGEEVFLFESMRKK